MLMMLKPAFFAFAMRSKGESEPSEYVVCKCRSARPSTHPSGRHRKTVREVRVVANLVFAVSGVEAFEFLVVVDDELVSLKLKVVLLDKHVHHARYGFTRRAGHIGEILL